jgi:hypothetical protein
VGKKKVAASRSPGNRTIAAATSVFLNCPYDRDFQERFDALVFATVACGFIPRSALESGTVAEPRMARITQALFESKYSIHDLSRCTGEGDQNMARFNMPLELGIAMARRHLAKRRADRHDWLVLVPEHHPYQTFVSDLAGYDPVCYDGSLRGIVRAVLGWLVTREDAVATPDPQQVLEALPRFAAELSALRDRWGPSPPWFEVVLAAKKTARRIARR